VESLALGTLNMLLSHYDDFMSQEGALTSALLLSLKNEDDGILILVLLLNLYLTR